MSVGELFQSPLLPALLLVVAFLYASVGHGGASGYLALMSLFAFPVTVMKPTALVLNILVSAISFYFYFREKQFEWKLFYPFAVTSIPFSFLGGIITIETRLYKIILATVLLFAIARLIGLFGRKKQELTSVNVPIALFIGAFIGFLSGLIGIGGGIILSPVILLLGWADIKKSAGVSALFIFVNSISGLFGFLTKGGTLPISSVSLIAVALIGGFLGGYFGSKKMNTLALRNVLALVLLIAVFKLYTT
ncbi:sulfite exporter TauE/SafE family protein [Flavobacterium sp.]